MANRKKNNKEEVDYDALLTNIESDLKLQNLANAVYHQSRTYYRTKYDRRVSIFQDLTVTKETYVEAEDDFIDFKKRMTKGTEEHARDLDIEVMNNAKIMEQLRGVREKILEQKQLHQAMLQKREKYALELQETVEHLNSVYLNIVNLILDDLQTSLENDWTNYDAGSKNPMAELVALFKMEHRDREHVPHFPRVLRIRYQNIPGAIYDNPHLEQGFDLRSPTPHAVMEAVLCAVSNTNSDRG